MRDIFLGTWRDESGIEGKLQDRKGGTAGASKAVSSDAAALLQD